MGFFSLHATCAVCGKEIGLNRYQLANKEWICPACFKACGYNALTPIRGITADQAKQAKIEFAKSQEELQSFTATKKIASIMEVDENKKEVIFHTGILGGRGKAHVYKYEDIVSYELLEDGSSVRKGGLGRAVAGGVMFGGVGAVVGGVTGHKKTNNICEKLILKVTVNDMSNATVMVNLISSPTDKNSLTYKMLYKAAQEATSTLELICSSSNTEQQAAVSAPSSADEILKFKKLLDDGIITQDEFDKKKSQLLGL